MPKTSEEAKEILNDGFIKVFQHIKRFKYNPKQPFKAWLRRILINAAIDHFRQQKKHYYHTDIEEIPHELDTYEPTIVNQLSYDEIMVLVQQLSPAYRMVFNLHVVEGYKHPEIARKLGISVGASKSNLAKAKKKSKIYGIKTLRSTLFGSCLKRICRKTPEKHGGTQELGFDEGAWHNLEQQLDLLSPIAGGAVATGLKTTLLGVKSWLVIAATATLLGTTALFFISGK